MAKDNDELGWWKRKQAIRKEEREKKEAAHRQHIATRMKEYNEEVLGERFALSGPGDLTYTGTAPYHGTVGGTGASVPHGLSMGALHRSGGLAAPSFMSGLTSLEGKREGVWLIDKQTGGIRRYNIKESYVYAEEDTHIITDEEIELMLTTWWEKKHGK